MAGLTEDIIPLIPQKAPFVMAGRLIYSDDKISRSSYVISADNILTQDGFFTEAGLVENIAQTAAARVGYMAKQLNREVPIGYIGAIKDLEIFALPKINDEIETEISVDNQIFEVTIITGRVKCGGQLLAQCEMKIFISR